MKNAFGGLLSTHRHYTHSWIHKTLVDLLAIQKEIHAGLFAVMRAETWTGPTNVGGDLELSVCELVELCRSLFGPLETVSAPAEDEHDPQRRCPSLVRLKALGWGPSVDLSTGLRRTMDWIRSLPETSP